MATQTDHMKLTKPAYTDSADIAVINSNMDAIDTATSKILPVISGTTNNSGYTIASGEYFEANGKLYKANASIPTNQAWSSSATEQSDHGAINALNGNLQNYALKSDVTVHSTGIITLTTDANGNVALSSVLPANAVPIYAARANGYIFNGSGYGRYPYLHDSRTSQEITVIIYYFIDFT